MKNLRDFIHLLEENGELFRVSHPVSRDLEITEIVDRVAKGPADKNKALLFENVEGFDMPVAINLFGSEKRMAAGLYAENLDDIGERLGALLDMKLPQGAKALIGRGTQVLGALKSIAPKPTLTRNAPCQEVVHIEDASLNHIPILKSWPLDGGRFITLPQVITRDPEKNTRNVGMYRLQVVDEKTLLMHWQRHKGGAEHERVAKLKGEKTFPAAIVLGGDPAGMWSASAPLPPNIDEYLLAGWLRGNPVSMTEAVTQPLKVPAQAEIVIEGYVDVNEQQAEGPFGDHTGYYTPVEYFPTFHVTAITHRQNPIYPATVVGIPPMEDAWMGKATERIFLPLMKLMMPEIVDVHLPPSGVFHNLALVSIKKRYPGHARKVIHGLWGLGLMSLTKAIVIVDDWVDVQNLNLAAWQALGNTDWKRDIILTEGSVDQLDHASPMQSYGGKIGIDATAKLPEEGHPRAWPQPVRMDDETKQRIDEIWDSLGL